MKIPVVALAFLLVEILYDKNLNITEKKYVAKSTESNEFLFFFYFFIFFWD